MNHFVHEKTDFRLLFTRALLAAGWRDLFEEIGWIPRVTPLRA